MDTRRSVFAILASIVVSICLTASARAQIAGENVNMVSGTQWPGGDPFLQRQNEPSLAVSSANPQHLLAGANDYRTVDIAFPDVGEKKTTGDAWLGVFKSLDGGQTWKSVLLPGYPQDEACRQGGPGNPLCGLPAAADPVVRAGTDGIFYYAGINFQRDKKSSRVFVARFVDLNNKEAGDATVLNADGTRGSDPIRYLGTKVVASQDQSSIFIDKPWIAVDVPRPGSGSCTIPGGDGEPARTVAAGIVYVAWAQFTIDAATGNETRSDVMLSWSNDCGATWAPPLKLNGANSKLNQAVTIAIEPITGRVFVAWRRFGTAADAVMVARSFGRKRVFTVARAIPSKVVAFDQGTSETSFRTDSWPTMAISTDGKSSWAHVAWQHRLGPGADARIVMSTAQVYPTPAGDQDDEDPEEYENENRLVWSQPNVVDGSLTDAGGSFTRGHQFMPALTFGQGRLMLTYYDSRLDHTLRVYKPNSILVPPFYDEELVPIGELPAYGDAVFNSWLTDVNLTAIRHTIAVRVASAKPGANPTFTSVPVSKFPLGFRGDEANAIVPFNVRTVRNSDLTVVDEDHHALPRQLQVNPPNLPMFAGGTVPFLGDYIDIQGPAFVPNPSGTGWIFNHAPTSAPVFHAAWTSNQDVRLPLVEEIDPITLKARYKVDWTKYTPVGLGDGRRSIYDPTKTCAPCVAATAGSRDQNIYTSRITEGLTVSSPQNVKPLSRAFTRAFVIGAQNGTGYPLPVTFRASTAADGVAFSFVNDFGAGVAAVDQLSAVIPPYSGVARSLFVRLTTDTASPSSTLAVTVNESGCTAGTCRSGFVTLNPPVALASLLKPDGSGQLGEEHATLEFGPGAIAGTSGIFGNPAPPILTATILSPSMLQPGVAENLDVALAPSMLQPSMLQPSMLQPSMLQPSMLQPSMLQPNVSDVSYVVTNTGDTTTSYHLKVVAKDRTNLPPMQLVVTNTYTTPVASGCELRSKAHEQLVTTVAVGPGGTIVGTNDPSPAIVSPTDTVDPGVQIGGQDNLTFSIPPGGSRVLTVRAPLTLGEMATTVAGEVKPAVVSSSVKPDPAITYANAPPSTVAAVTGDPTVTTITFDYSSNVATATVTAPSSGAIVTGGIVTFIRNGTASAGWPTVTAGTAAAHLELALGDTLIAYYSGFGRFAPSTSPPAQGRVVPTIRFTSSPNPASYGQSLTLDVFVSPPSGGPQVTGALTIREGSNVIGSCFYPVPSGVYRCGVSFKVLSVGTHSFTADYGGDPHYLPASASLAQLVTDATAMSLVTDVLPWAPQVTFTASLTALGASPTGTVVFSDDAAHPLAEVPLACTPHDAASPARFDCQASFMTLEPFPQGSRSVVATYSGDAIFASSTSNPIEWTMPPYTAPGQTVMDTGTYLLAVGGASDQKIAQVVAGSAGRIAGIRVPVACGPGAQLKIEIKGVTANEPNTLDLIPPMTIANASELLPDLYPSLQQFRTILFGTPATVSATDPSVIWGSFAVVLSATGNCSMWQGPIGNPYGGTSYEAFYDARPNAPGVWVYTGERHDIPFQVFMQLVQ